MAAVVTPINPEVRRLDAPVELQGLQGWLIWRLEDNGAGKPLKVLGSGQLTAKVFVMADSYTASAKSKIEAAGGTAQVYETPVVPTTTVKGSPATPGKRAPRSKVDAKAGAQES